MKFEDGGTIGADWVFMVTLGKGPKAQSVPMPFNTSNPAIQQWIEAQQRDPVPIEAFMQQLPFDPDFAWDADLDSGGIHSGFIFRKRIVWVSNAGRVQRGREWREMVKLSVKKFVLLQERARDRLRSDVEALERVADSESPRRAPISREVKIIVFERDQGSCVDCSSTTDLHFDHIIPVAKGGSNSAENIQILCQRCNLEKGDRIM